jgi:hypothetical protein
MKEPLKPSLFGLSRSNRDLSQGANWGKNQFNNAFPVALACYMSSKDVSPVYLQLDANRKVTHGKITVREIFSADPLAPETFYAFESIHAQYETLVAGGLPRIDLVVCKTADGVTTTLRGIEIKLTALPDNSTFDGPETEYGTEVVVRPDTIVYLALSVASNFLSDRGLLLERLQPLAEKIKDWRSLHGVLPHLNDACDALDNILLDKLPQQKPLVLQPIWKTVGKKLILNDNCLDAFAWSDFAFTRLFIDPCRESVGRGYVTRHARSALWLAKMLYDFALNGKMNHERVIDELTFDTKNDKAFACGGLVTRKYMRCAEIIKPRITKNEIKCIILGGGEKLLSPERRFDAAVMGTPGLFDDTLS